MSGLDDMTTAGEHAEHWSPPVLFWLPGFSRYEVVIRGGTLTFGCATPWHALCPLLQRLEETRGECTVRAPPCLFADTGRASGCARRPCRSTRLLPSRLERQLGRKICAASAVRGRPQPLLWRSSDNRERVVGACSLLRPVRRLPRALRRVHVRWRFASTHAGGFDTGKARGAITRPVVAGSN